MNQHNQVPCVAPAQVDTSSNGPVVKRFQGTIGKALTVESWIIGNLKELWFIFVRYNKDIVVIQEISYFKNAYWSI